MTENIISPEALKKAKQWLSKDYDKETRNTVAYLLENNLQEIEEAFYKNLEFGTGGMRGIMGPGTNRMNQYTVGMATQGLANYLLKQFPNEEIKVAIAHDCRNNSSEFAAHAANIFSANNIQVYLFDSLRPTPELSFAIRYFNCKSGIVITASHNPKEYNGFKAYWDDGAQVVEPHDKNIITEVQNITNIKEIKTQKNAELITMLDQTFDEVYIDEIQYILLNKEDIEKKPDIKIVYTPLHGTGTKIVPQALKEAGFTNITTISEQNITDGNFPTVVSPNPEEPAALKMALKKAKEIDADIVMATDPDSDRVGIAIKNNHNEFVLVNGNQTAVLLAHYQIKNWKNKNLLTGNEYVVKTIVTTDLINRIANKNNVKLYETLTGFKHIAKIIRDKEGQEKYIGGGEESFGYLPGDYVRDKDAVATILLIAEMVAHAKTQNQSLFDSLLDIYKEYGFYKERLISIVKKGKEGAELIQKMMNDFRNNAPSSINGIAITEKIDYLNQSKLPIPSSNVLQFKLEDGSVVTMRPSGTEPKIKFYFSVNTELIDKENFDKIETNLEAKIDAIIKDLNIK